MTRVKQNTNIVVNDGSKNHQKSICAYIPLLLYLAEDRTSAAKQVAVF
jgi:hypothetical protein